MGGTYAGELDGSIHVVLVNALELVEDACARPPVRGVDLNHYTQRNTHTHTHTYIYYIIGSETQRGGAGPPVRPRYRIARRNCFDVLTSLTMLSRLRPLADMLLAKIEYKSGRFAVSSKLSHQVRSPPRGPLHAARTSRLQHTECDHNKSLCGPGSGGGGGLATLAAHGTRDAAFTGHPAWGPWDRKTRPPNPRPFLNRN